MRQAGEHQAARLNGLVTAVTVFPPRSECRDPRAKAARRLRTSSGKGAQGPDDTNAQDARTVWAMSPPYNGTAATSRETIIRSPSRTGTSREESRTEPVQRRVFTTAARQNVQLADREKSGHVAAS